MSPNVNSLDMDHHRAGVSPSLTLAIIGSDQDIGLWGLDELDR